MKTDKTEALGYFCDEFRKALTEKLDGYIDHYGDHIEKFRIKAVDDESE